MDARSAPLVDQQLLTVKEVAVLLRVSKSHLSKIINGRVAGTPVLPASRLGRRLLIQKKSLEDWLLLVDTRRGFE